MKRKLTGTDLARAMNGVDARWIELAYDEEELKKAAVEESRTGRTHTGKLFGAEVKKLLGARVVWVFLALFVALNFFLAWKAAGRTAEAAYPTSTVAGFFDGYFENPEEYEAR